MDGILSIVVFTATKCPHCPEVKKALEELEAENEKLAITVINVDDSPHARNMARTWEVMNVPHFIFIKDRNVQNRVSEALTKSQIEEYVTRYL